MFDFKKEYREFYLPKTTPEIVTVPPANYIAVRGEGDPNIEGERGVDYSDKAAFHWISVIRVPEFITRADFDWAVETASKKKKLELNPGNHFQDVELRLAKGIAWILEGKQK